MSEPDYTPWIAAHLPADPRGQCAAVTEAMAAAFPELRRVRGFYECPIEGRRPHWWMATRAGLIIDPTACQFPSNGIGLYVEHVGPEPTGQCLNCGSLLFGAGLEFCNAECAWETAQFLMRDGGTVVINGKRVWGPEDTAAVMASDLPIEADAEGRALPDAETRTNVRSAGDHESDPSPS
jgi:hypothetical protein